MTTAYLTVPDIACNACAQAIRTVLGATAGVGSVNVDVTGKTVQVEFDDRTVALAEIERRLAGADFPVTASQVA